MSADALPSPPLRLRPARALVRRGDEDLRALAAAGDAAAFGELYRRHHQPLFRYCRSIVRHDDDAADALHSTWTKAWAALCASDRDVPVRPWLFRIAHNEAVSILRRRRDHDELDAGGEPAARAPSLETDLEVRERLAVLRADLAQLPERQRSALLLRELCGLGHDEIAAVFSVTPAAAKQSIYEARIALAEAEAGRSMTCAQVQRRLSDGDGRVRRGRRLQAHLRACKPCAAFQGALARRPAELAALLPPLPAAAAAGLLARLVGGAGGTGAVGAHVGTAALAVTGTKLGAGVAAKVAGGMAVLAVAATGTAEVAIHRPHPPAAAPARAASLAAPVRSVTAPRRVASAAPASAPAPARVGHTAPARPIAHGTAHAAGHAPNAAAGSAARQPKIAQGRALGHVRTAPEPAKAPHRGPAAGRPRATRATVKAKPARTPGKATIAGKGTPPARRHAPVRASLAHASPAREPAAPASAHTPPAATTAGAHGAKLRSGY